MVARPKKVSRVFFFFFGVVYEISSGCFSKEQKEN